MKIKSVLVVLAAGTLMTQACSKSSDSDGTFANPGGFVNKANESEFFAKGDSLRSMLEGGARLAPKSTSQPTRRSILQGGTFSLLDSFASGGSSQTPPRNPSASTPSRNSQSDCDFLEGTIDPGLAGAPASGSKKETETTGFQLRENETCESSLSKVKANYSMVLQAIPKQIEALRNVGSIPESCGVKARKLEPNSETEAIGYEFTPTNVDDKADFGLQARGAADGDKVAVFLKMWVRAKIDEQTSGQGQSPTTQGPTSIDASGEFNNIGDLTNNSLESNLSVNLAMSQPEFSVNANVSHSIFAGGLGAKQLASILETSNINAQMDAANGQSQAVNATMSVQVKELSASQIEVSGEVTSDNKTQKFKMTMSKSLDGTCRVVGVTQQ